jgi:sulfate/thiosulfate transport system permease protein
VPGGVQQTLGPRVSSPEAAVTKYVLRFTALFYLAFLLVVPVGVVFRRTFENGFSAFWDAVTTPEALHAFKITLVVSLCAVVLNTIFGVGVSLLLVRREFRGKRVLNLLIDLPLAISPVVVGLALILVYGRNTTIGEWFSDHGIDILYALPAMVMATAFVSLPLVVREVVPVLEEVGTEQEQAASTLGASPVQTFRRITLPSIRWALVYGIILTLARSLGEFGAVAVVSGRIRNQTQTLTLLVQERYTNFDQEGAYAIAFTLALIAIVAMFVMTAVRPRET